MTEPSDDSGIVVCMISTCGWSLDLMGEDLSYDGLASIYPGLSVAKRQAEAKKVERALEEHLKTHSVTEWAKDLAEARDAFYAEQDESEQLAYDLTTARELIAALNDHIETLKASGPVLAPARRAQAFQGGQGADEAEHLVLQPGETLTRSGLIRRRVRPDDIKYSQDLPGGVVGRKT